MPRRIRVPGESCAGESPCRRGLPIALLIVTAALLSRTARAPAGMVIEQIDFPGALDTVAFGINSHGTVVGQYGEVDLLNFPNLGNKGFVFDGDSFQTIEVPDSLYTSAHGINDHGTVVGEYLTSLGELRGFVYDGDSFLDVVTPFSAHASVAAINSAGAIVGAYFLDSSGASPTGFTFDGESFEPFHRGSTTDTLLNGINNRGQRVGTVLTSRSAEGVLLPEGTAIIHPAGSLTQASDINDLGQVVGRYLTVFPDFRIALQGYLLDVATGEFQTIESPGPVCSINPVTGSCAFALNGINNLGSMVGFFDDAQGRFHGFIRSAAQAGDFNSDGRVDGRDFLIWQSGFGMAAGAERTNGDADADFDVDSEDYLIWQSALQPRNPPGAVVPEPTSILTFLCGCAFVFLRMRSRGKV